MEPAVLDIKGAARYVGCSVESLRHWKKHNRGPTYLKLGNLLRYRIKDLDEWLENNKVALENNK